MALRLPQIDRSDPADYFPPTSQALQDPNGLLAFGGDLSCDRLLEAYKRGIFPWFSEGDPILWWSPDPRTIFYPGQIHCSRRLSRKIKQQNFAVTLDQAFEPVVFHCAREKIESDGTWLLPVMRSAYAQMHQHGYAHSIEIWQQGQLVAGLYGIALGRAFFGESMFCHVTDMSKIALVSLSRQLKKWGFVIMDAQIPSPHLASLGAKQITRTEFETTLRRAIPARPQPSIWQIDSELSGSTQHLPEHAATVDNG